MTQEAGGLILLRRNPDTGKTQYGAPAGDGVLWWDTMTEAVLYFLNPTKEASYGK